MSAYSSFARFYDALTKNVDYAAAADMIQAYVKRFNASGNILLDLACGTGSLSEELARRGFDVIGTDASEDMLNCAVEKKLEGSLPIQYLCQDMRELDMFGTVDITVCSLDSLNHLDTPEELDEVFEKVSLFSAPGALFIFDVNTLHKHRNVLSDSAYIYDLEEIYCGWQNEYDKTDNSVSIYLDFFEKTDDGAYRRYSESFREIYLPRELIEKCAEKHSFEILGCFDGYTLDPLDENSERAVYVLRRRRTNAG